MTFTATFGRAFASELKKITTLTGSWITAAAAIVVTVGLTGTSSSSIRDYIGQSDLTGTGSLSSQFATMMITLFIMFTIATSCKFVTNEYSTNTIQMSLLSTNSRLKFYGAKYLAFLTWWGAITLLTLLLNIVIVQMMYAGEPSGGFDFGNGSTLMGFASFLLVNLIIATMGIGTAMLLRSTAGSITAMFGLLFVLQLISAIPGDFFSKLGEYLPFSLMNVATAPRDMSNLGDLIGTISDVSPNHALGLFAVWGFALLVLGGLRLLKTDA